VAPETGNARLPTVEKRTGDDDDDGVGFAIGDRGFSPSGRVTISTEVA